MKSYTAWTYQNEDGKYELFAPEELPIPIHMESDCVVVDGFPQNVRHFGGPHQYWREEPRPLIEREQWLWDSNSVYLVDTTHPGFIIKVTQWGNKPVLTVPEYVVEERRVCDKNLSEEVANLYKMYPLLVDFYLEDKVDIFLTYHSTSVELDCMGQRESLYIRTGVRGVKVSLSSEHKEKFRQRILAITNSLVQKDFNLTGNDKRLEGIEIWTLELTNGMELVVEWKEDVDPDIEEYHGCEVVRTKRTTVYASMVCKSS